MLMDFETALRMFNGFYDHMNGHAISQKGREIYHHEGKAFVYGEILPESFYTFISRIHPVKGDIFYDLGSGTGKAVLLAHLLFNFSESKGIELVKTLFDESNMVKTLWMAYMKIHMVRWKKAGLINEAIKLDRTLSFIHGSFLEVDFSDASVVYMNSTCWPDGLMEQLHTKLALLKKGARIISVSTGLNSDESASYELIDQCKYAFSWGDATVYTSIKET